MKISVGDYVGIDYLRVFGYVIADRGGHVGRWTIKTTDGDTHHASSRDLRVIRQKEMPTHPNCRSAIVYVNKLTTEQKLDLLLEHLGLTIEDEPRIIEIKKEDGDGSID
jgi:hypothetical protein